MDISFSMLHYSHQWHIRNRDRRGDLAIHIKTLHYLLPPNLQPQKRPSNPNCMNCLNSVIHARPHNFTAMRKNTAKTSPPALKFVPTSWNHYISLPHTPTALNIKVHSLIVHCQAKARLLSLAEMCISMHQPHSRPPISMKKEKNLPSLNKFTYTRGGGGQKIKHVVHVVFHSMLTADQTPPLTGWIPSEIMMPGFIQS